MPHVLTAADLPVLESSAPRGVLAHPPASESHTADTAPRHANRPAVLRTQHAHPRGRSSRRACC
jgi:hypothetical protein